MNSNDYFSRRRTIRSYSDRSIDDALLSDILSQAMRAPTTGNMQLYSVVVTRSEEMKERLAPAHFNQPTVRAASVVLTICADVARFEHWCRVSNAEPGFRNLQGLMFAIADAYIYAQQVVTIAEMNGIGTCYLGTVTFNAPQIAEILNLPEGVVPVATLTLGWPEGDTPLCERLPLEAIMHKETYRRDSDADVIALHRSKDEFPVNAGYVAENGKQTLAQVFTDVRYPREANEQFSEVFLDYIRTHGFKI